MICDTHQPSDADAAVSHGECSKCATDASEVRGTIFDPSLYDIAALDAQRRRAIDSMARDAYKRYASHHAAGNADERPSEDWPAPAA